jgi:hypothetical protein
VRETLTPIPLTRALDAARLPRLDLVIKTSLISSFYADIDDGTLKCLSQVMMTNP